MDSCTSDSSHKKIVSTNQTLNHGKTAKTSQSKNVVESSQSSGQVSFTDFSEITSLQKPTSDSSNVVKLPVANGGQSTSSQIANESYVIDDTHYVTRHDLPQTLKPFGTNRRLQRLISLVNRKRRVVLQEGFLTEKMS